MTIGGNLTTGMQNGIQGVQTNISGVNNALESSNTDLAKATTESMVSQRGVEANVSSVQTNEEMFKSLLDIKA
ncbi:MAG: hypothetical protein K2N12_03835 [Helicobacter sp.]|uniref:Flagellar basal-body/hook protein C-terminal domain-containing protein n=1 Tax=uncultured prokaryote TaxID=198431 RepID=A0A0H5QQ50_9ZZZZ|nr:hypothetical protein [Helicobacter sp.]CRY97812.1 hypothetical protein [uncultured prokaryote]